MSIEQTGEDLVQQGINDDFGLGKLREMSAIWSGDMFTVPGQ